MPKYNYRCDSCGHEFSIKLKVDERSGPVDEDCPNCDSRGHISLVVGTPMVSYSVNPGLKTSGEFNSRMQEIASSKGAGHTIQTRRDEI